MHTPAATVRLLDTPSDHAAFAALLARVWVDPSGSPPIEHEVFVAAAHVGGYVAGAFIDGVMVGGGFGFLGRFRGESVLHSHVVCVAPGLEHHGIGFQIKQHQRSWATEQSLATITWTFDPLLRRNAYFNLAKLGARVVGYEVDFYGPLRDATNAGDETDRAIVVWSVDDAAHPERACTTRTTTATSDTERVWIPDDVVALRQSDPVAARALRIRVREELGARVRDGWNATAMTRDGWYTLERP